MTTAPAQRRLVPDPYDPEQQIDITDLPQPVPTDEASLIEYVIAHRPWWDGLRGAVAAQIGSDRAMKLVDQVETEIAQCDLVEKTRADLREDLSLAEQQVRAVRATLRALTGDEIFDVEYAEGGIDVEAMAAELEKAHHSIIAAIALNPCGKPEPLTVRTHILRTATVNDATRTGYIEYKRGYSGVYVPNVDMAELATIVADGLGEFVRQEDSPRQVKPIIGVRLNEAGYAAAKAAGAEVAF